MMTFHNKQIKFLRNYFHESKNTMQLHHGVYQADKGYTAPNLVNEDHQDNETIKTVRE